LNFYQSTLQVQIQSETHLKNFAKTRHRRRTHFRSQKTADGTRMFYRRLAALLQQLI